MVNNTLNDKVDLSVKIGKLKLQNPIILASGTYGYCDEFENYMESVPFGALITKGITLKPRSGNSQPRLKEIKNGLINSIGLENIGIDAFIEKKIPILKQKKIPFIINIAGFSFEEYEKISKICEINKIEAIEVNVSCPNVKGGCLDFASNSETLYNLVCLIREVYSGTLIVKLSSVASNCVEQATRVQQAGADAISAINTVKAMKIKVNIDDSKISFDKIQGGMSGPVIKPIALNYIYTIAQNIKIPIIGMGGISSLDDIFEFTAVGSSAFQIGTANFINPAISEFILDDLRKFLLENNYKTFEEFTSKCRM